MDLYVCVFGSFVPLARVVVENLIQLYLLKKLFIVLIILFLFLFIAKMTNFVMIVIYT